MKTRLTNRNENEKMIRNNDLLLESIRSNEKGAVDYNRHYFSASPVEKSSLSTLPVKDSKAEEEDELNFIDNITKCEIAIEAHEREQAKIVKRRQKQKVKTQMSTPQLLPPEPTAVHIPPPPPSPPFFGDDLSSAFEPLTPPPLTTFYYISD